MSDSAAGLGLGGTASAVVRFNPHFESKGENKGDVPDGFRSEGKYPTRQKARPPALETSLYGDFCVAKVAIAAGVVAVIIAALFAAGLFGKGTPDCNPQFYAVPIGVSGLVAILLGAVCYPSKQTAKTTAAAVQSLKTEEDAQMQKALEASRREAAPTLTLPPPNAPAKTGAAAGPALEIKEEKKS